MARMTPYISEADLTNRWYNINTLIPEDSKSNNTYSQINRRTTIERCFVTEIYNSMSLSRVDY